LLIISLIKGSCNFVTSDFPNKNPHTQNHLTITGMNIKLIPITTDRKSKQTYLKDAFCVEFYNIYKELYPKIGFNKPWIGYFALHNDEVIGVGGFKGVPNNNTVEIAYGTVPKKEGLGFANKICKQLTLIALNETSNLKITARTLMEESASTHILRKNNYNFIGIVEDPNDGKVWEWEFQKD